jgi:hypothetical protein
MTRHPLDRDRDFADDPRKAKYPELDRKTAPDGSHPSVKAAIKRPQKTTTSGEIDRARKAVTAT